MVDQVPCQWPHWMSCFLKVALTALLISRCKLTSEDRPQRSTWTGTNRVFKHSVFVLLSWKYGRKISLSRKHGRKIMFLLPNRSCRLTMPLVFELHIYCGCCYWYRCCCKHGNCKKFVRSIHSLCNVEVNILASPCKYKLIPLTGWRLLFCQWTKITWLANTNGLCVSTVCSFASVYLLTLLLFDHVIFNLIWWSSWWKQFSYLAA